MEFEEMNQRAFRREDTPHGLTPAERVIWLALCLLYELHFCGRLTREEGARLKAQLACDFALYRRQERAWLHCETALKLLRRNDMPLVRGIVEEVDRMFDEEDKPWHGCAPARVKHRAGQRKTETEREKKYP